MSWRWAPAGGQAGTLCVWVVGGWVGARLRGVLSTHLCNCVCAAPPRALPPAPSSPAHNVPRRYRRAELALKKGDDELAKEALTRRKAYAVSWRCCTCMLWSAGLLPGCWSPPPPALLCSLPPPLHSAQSIPPPCPCCSVQDNAAQLQQQLELQSNAVSTIIGNMRVRKCWELGGRGTVVAAERCRRSSPARTTHYPNHPPNPTPFTSFFAGAGEQAGGG